MKQSLISEGRRCQKLKHSSWARLDRVPRLPSAPDHFLYYFLYFRAYVSSPERPRSLSLLLSLLQSVCFEPRAPQITFFTTFFTTFLKFKRPQVPGHETFLKFQRPEVPGHEIFLKFQRPEMIGLRAHPSARLSIAPLFHVLNQESTMGSIHLL